MIIATATIANTKIAQLTLNGMQVSTGTFAAMKRLERSYLSSGYKQSVLHVGYAPYHNGAATCKRCGDLSVKPYVQKYQGHEYYTCAKCQTINYVN